MRISAEAKLIYGISFCDIYAFREYFENIYLNSETYNPDDVERIMNNLNGDGSPIEFIDSLEHNIKLKHRMFDVHEFGEPDNAGVIVSPMEWDKNKKCNNLVKIASDEQYEFIHINKLKVSKKLKNKFLRNLSKYKLDTTDIKLRWYLCYSLESY